MPTELQNLATIFNNRVFRVPDYQRGYAWVDAQLTDFWDDLNQLGPTRNHYTGQLTLERVPGSTWQSWDDDTWLIDGKGYHPFYVVDGQQRLITSIILIKCILDRIPDNGQLVFSEKSDHVKKFLVQSAGISLAYIFGYQRDNPSYEYFKTQIIGQPSIQYDEIETTYTENLLYAREFFRRMVKNSDIPDLERLFKSLTQRFVYNVYELVEDLNVFVVFETMNNRGKKLSTLELLKNRLIYLSTNLPSPAGEVERGTLRKNVNDAWKTVFEYLGKEKNNALDDDDFLWAHWAMYFKYNRDEANALEKFLLTEHFTVRKVADGDVNAKCLQDYVASIQNSVRKWHEVHFPHRDNSLSDAIRRSLERLDRLGRGAFEPLLMAALQISKRESELQELLQSAERFIFVVNRLCRVRADAGDNEFYRLAHEVFRERKTLPEATYIINERTDRHFSKDKAITEMRELFRYDSGFYSWSGLRYFLFEYEQHLRKQAKKEEEKVNWTQFTMAKRDHVTIEHIYPCTPEKDDWPGFSQERDTLTNSLGNLLALSQSRNASFSNRPFSVKKQDAKGVNGYYNGSYSEIAVAQFAEWTPEAVLKRGLDMVRFLENRWNISLGSHLEKKQFLRLEFMEGD